MVADGRTGDDVGTRERYFDSLCRAHGLELGLADSCDGWSLISAHRGSLRIFFEYERGFWWFGVGSTADGRPACSVEDIATRFPSTRVLRAGAQRLSLEEQRLFIEQHWNELEAMFSPIGIAATKAWLADRLNAYWAQFTSST